MNVCAARVLTRRAVGSARWRRRRRGRGAAARRRRSASSTEAAAADRPAVDRPTVDRPTVDRPWPWRCNSYYNVCSQRAQPSAAALRRLGASAPLPRHTRCRAPAQRAVTAVGIVANLACSESHTAASRRRRHSASSSSSYPSPSPPTSGACARPVATRSAAFSSRTCPRGEGEGMGWGEGGRGSWWELCLQSKGWVRTAASASAAVI